VSRSNVLQGVIDRGRSEWRFTHFDEESTIPFNPATGTDALVKINKQGISNKKRTAPHRHPSRLPWALIHAHLFSRLSKKSLPWRLSTTKSHGYTDREHVISVATIASVAKTFRSPLRVSCAGRRCGGYRRRQWFDE
jgi:hypothetical protein